MNKTWWKESVVYQIYPRSFMDSNGDGIGDLRGIIPKLDYLKELGIDIIWLCPIYRSPNDDNGYDISDYHDIMSQFGTMEDFDQLLEEIHQRGLKLMMDLVVNHTSDEHHWFIESRKSENNPYRDYYIWRKPKDGKEPNNWGSQFSGSAWDYDEKTGYYYLHCFSKKQPDLNWENPEVRNAVYKMMTWWLDKGIDGFRMDVINMISKAEGLPDADTQGMPFADPVPYVNNGPRVHEYLKEMNRRVLSRYDLVTVGETPHVKVTDAIKYTGDDSHELNMVFHFEHMAVDREKATKWCNKKMKLAELKSIMSEWQTELFNRGWNSLYWNNHDQPRVVSRFGNDRQYREISAKMLGTCLHMMQGTPYIYQGEELGMTNIYMEKISDYNDIQTVNAYNQMVNLQHIAPETAMSYIHRHSRDNARTPMQWDDSENAGFTTGTPWLKINPNYKVINAKDQVNDEASVYNYYKKLIRLRKQHEIIVYGSYELLLPDSEELYVYTRTHGDQKLLAICSFTENNVDYTLPEEFNTDEKTLLISNYECSNEGSSTNCNKCSNEDCNVNYNDCSNEGKGINDKTGRISLKPYETRVYLINQ